MWQPEQAQQELLAGYTLAVIRRIVRAAVLDSSAPGSQAIREKVVDWLRAHTPAGFRADGDRQEAWVYQHCHDEAYRMTDAALNFMLCGMHILSPLGLFGIAEAEDAPAPTAGVLAPVGAIHARRTLWEWVVPVALAWLWFAGQEDSPMPIQRTHPNAPAQTRR